MKNFLLTLIPKNFPLHLRKIELQQKYMKYNGTDKFLSFLNNTASVIFSLTSLELFCLAQRLGQRWLY